MADKKEVYIQFLSFTGCPLAEAARAELERAISQCGIDGYEEINILAEDVSEELAGWGSPTILVNGLDVCGQPKGSSVGCRIYPGSDRVVKSDAIIVSIERAQRA